MMAGMRTAGPVGYATDTPVPQRTGALVGARATRGRRAAALALDAGSGLLAALAAAVLATAWLLARTGRGALDPTDGDTALAFAVVAAVPAAWVAWLVLRLRRDAATPGQRALHLHVASARGLEAPAPAATRAVVRLAVHPLGAVGWAWLAMLTALAGGWPLDAAFGLVALAVAAAGLASAAMLLVRPHARPLHDRIAGTRVVGAPQRDQPATAQSARG